MYRKIINQTYTRPENVYIHFSSIGVTRSELSGGVGAFKGNIMLSGAVVSLLLPQWLLIFSDEKNKLRKVTVVK